MNIVTCEICKISSKPEAIKISNDGRKYCPPCTKYILKNCPKCASEIEEFLSQCNHFFSCDCNNWGRKCTKCEWKIY